jgi:hypothetical protein
MIDFVDQHDLNQLAEAQEHYCVSIYLPTFSAGIESTQNAIRFKNLIAQSRRELSSLGVGTRHIDDLLAEAAALHDDHEFWATMENGLAVFVNGDGMHTYRLPVSVGEIAVVTERFHLKPLIPALATGATFYLLALSRHEVRLLRGGRFQISELALRKIPASIDEALRFDDREPQLQSHAASRTGRGGTIAVFHGQGAGKDLDTVDLERFLTSVDAGFRDLVGGVPAPLVLAGVEHIVAHFRKVSHYGHIVDGSIKGNPERLDLDSLHAHAWPLVEPSLSAHQHAARRAVIDRSMPTLDTLPAAVVAANAGRVDSLFVPIEVQQWGTFDSDAGSAVAHETRVPGDRDLFDLAAVATLTHGGKVFVVDEAELPGGGRVAATLRF